MVLLTWFLYGSLFFGKGDNYNRDDLCIIIKLDTCIEYLNWYDGSMSFSDVQPSFIRSEFFLCNRALCPMVSHVDILEVGKLLVIKKNYPYILYYQFYIDVSYASVYIRIRCLQSPSGSKKVLYFLEIGAGNKKYVEYEFIGGFTHLINPLLTYKPLRLIRNYTSTKPDCIGH